MIEVVTITQSPENGLDVVVGNTNSGGHLTIGEVLEQVLSILSKEGHASRLSGARTAYPMMTDDDWALRRASFFLRGSPIMIDDVGSGA